MSGASPPTVPTELYPATSSLNLTDLQLLNHWLSSTYLAFGERPEDIEGWRTTVVDLGFRYPFLMRGILAVSALHLARLHPESSQHWLVVAASHQEQALPAHRFIINDVGRNMDENNIHAVNAYTILCMAESIACGGRVEIGDNHYSLEEVTEWMVRALAFQLFFKSQHPCNCGSVVANHNSWLS